MIMEDCIFCKIIKGDIPCTKVYEDQSTIAFLDINPSIKGHVLVCTKKHYPTLLEVDKKEYADLFSALKRIGKAVQEGLNADGFNVRINNNRAAGQEVFHFHMHVLPRYDNDGKRFGLGHEKYENNEMKEYAEKLKSKINLASFNKSIKNKEEE